MKPSWIACWVTEKAPEITAWLAMIVAKVARMTSGRRSISGARKKNGFLTVSIASAGRHRQQHRALPHVVEQQRRHDEIDPRHADRVAPEMAHVGIERLGAGHREHDRAHGDERRDRIVEEEGERRSSGLSMFQITAG